MQAVVIQERTATLTKPFIVQSPTDPFRDSETLPAGTKGVFLRREWRTFFPSEELAGKTELVNVVRVNTKYGTRFLMCYDEEVEVQS